MAVQSRSGVVRVFDLRSPFGVLLGLNTQILLIGVTDTSLHIAEFFCDVPYRQTISKRVGVRRPDGTVMEQSMTDYQPKSSGGSYYDSRGPDFNRPGAMLERDGRVSQAYLGNAAVRRFTLQDLLDLAQIEAAKDFNVLAGTYTPLDFGQTVASPAFKNGAGRLNSVQWCVNDPALLKRPSR